MNRRYFDETPLPELEEGRSYDPVLSGRIDRDLESRWSDSAAEAEIREMQERGVLLMLSHPWGQVMSRAEFECRMDVLLTIGGETVELPSKGRTWSEVRDKIADLGGKPASAFFRAGGGQKVTEGLYCEALRDRLGGMRPGPVRSEVLRRGALGECPGGFGPLTEAAVRRCWASVCKELGGDPAAPAPRRISWDD